MKIQDFLEMAVTLFRFLDIGDPFDFGMMATESCFILLRVFRTSFDFCLDL